MLANPVTTSSSVRSSSVERRYGIVGDCGLMAAYAGKRKSSTKQKRRMMALRAPRAATIRTLHVR